MYFLNIPLQQKSNLVHFFFFFNDTATTEIYTLSLHDALPIYQLSYDQSGPATITDPQSGTPESTAGRLGLSRLQVVGGDGMTALPARTFTYTPVVEYYEDSLGLPKPGSNCGPSWNNGITPNGH